MRISLNELKSLIRSEARRSLKREANRDFERDFRDTPQDEPDGPRRVPGPGDLDYEEDVCDRCGGELGPDGTCVCDTDEELFV